MFGSSLSQFIYATSHILWGQASEAYGHVRHAIENAGIAHLSVSEPTIVELYRDRKDYDRATQYPAKKLFPNTNSLTRELKKMKNKADKHLHGNLYSNEFRLVEDSNYTESGNVGSFSFTFTHNDDMTLDYVWETCFFVLTAAVHVAQLYGKTFALPYGDWHRQLESFKSDLDKTDRKFQREIDQRPPS